MVWESVISQIETSAIKVRKESRETTPEIEVENSGIEPSPSISCLDYNTTLEQVGFTLFGKDISDEEEGASNVKQPPNEVIFSFFILDLNLGVVMKKTPHSVLPQFDNMVTKHPDSFLFEFDILCHSYNYVNDGKKLKLFLKTLKYSSL